ncbi:MAG: aminotransferase class V-fold PLP-dependent enzyme [Bacteroidales bacterium]|jgi:selenocysteine lyase/cysteine desulfurase|nr:aminotransferase class V-fold PLP-dependent enzyme [Bacteroidales bacterium]
MEKYFEHFRQQTIGTDLEFDTPVGKQKMIYADWVASGRLYAPIEDKIKNLFGPWVANTHTETSESGTLTTKAYQHAQQIIKKHVNANSDDVLITTGNGMTGVINKFQRILGLKRYGTKDHPFNKLTEMSEEKRPVVFITHMEHHSNQTSWEETIVDVVVLEPDENMMVDENELRNKLEEYKNREIKIGSFTACSNVTGVRTDHHHLARIMHENKGLCFIDFAASAPYDNIDLHPEDEMESLDAIFFSPHKFLGGPGSSGVLIFNKELYTSNVPDNPGGGTVEWTNPWGQYRYVDNIEAREDGGTPGFLQAIRIALAIKLKEKMGVENIHKREIQLIDKAFKGLKKIPKLHSLSENIKDRLGIVSFYIEDIHFNLIVKILNDRFGVQVRGGCACAGTYGHFLLGVTPEKSKEISDKINSGDLSDKPGWVRLSLHPTMTDVELDYAISGLEQLTENLDEWSKEYVYNPKTNEFKHVTETLDKSEIIKPWFNLD